MGSFRRIIIAVVTCIAVSTVLLPGLGTTQDLKSQKGNLENIQNEIKEKKQEVRELLKKENSVITLLGTLDQETIQHRRKIKELREQRSELRKKSEEIKREMSRSRAMAEREKQNILRRLRNLYKLGQPGYLRVLLSSDNLRTFRTATHLTERIIEKDLNLLKEYRKEVARYRSAKEAHQKKEAKLKEVITNIREDQARLREKRGRQRSLLRLVQNQRDFQNKAVAELEEAAVNLERLIQRLKSSGTRGKFPQAKGTLPYPIEGSLELRFGEQGKRNLLQKQGISFKAARGTPVRAVYDGKVIYSSWFTGYGNIIIIDHGDGFYSLSAHAEELLKQVGDKVRQGDIVARAGESGSLRGPHLYFELRHRGKAIDPTPWFLPLHRQD